MRDMRKKVCVGIKIISSYGAQFCNTHTHTHTHTNFEYAAVTLSIPSNASHPNTQLDSREGHTYSVPSSCACTMSRQDLPWNQTVR